MTDRSVVEALAALGFAERADELAPFAGFELALVPDPAGTSWIGGVPDVPAGFVWPCQRWPLAEIPSWPPWSLDELATARAAGQVHDEGDELVMPLAFLAQIDRGDHHDLFFASLSTPLRDPRFSHRVAAAIRRARGPLRPATPPATVDRPPLRQPMRIERTLRCWMPWELRQALPKSAVLTALDEVRDAVDPWPVDEGIPLPPPGFTPVLRIVEHAELELFIGDASWVTFCVPTADLAAGRFDDAAATVFVG